MSQDSLNQQLKEFVTAAKTNDQAAIKKIIDLTQQRLFKFCILIGHNRELAEDLCQEAYIKAFQSLDKLKSDDAFYPWLCQIAKNLFYDHQRKQKEVLSRTGEDSPVEESYDRAYEKILHVQKVLQSFDPDDRFLILMVELEGLSYRETADILKTTEDAIRSKLHRLKQEFIKKLK